MNFVLVRQEKSTKLAEDKQKVVRYRCSRIYSQFYFLDYVCNAKIIDEQG